MKSLSQLLTFTLIVNSFTVHAQTVPKTLLMEGQIALTRPDKIGATAQKIQTFFSDPKNKPLFETKEVQALAQIQYKLVNYLRLEQDLKSSSCNIDRTKHSQRALEILNNTLSANQCYEMSPYAYSDHTKVTSLIEEQKMNEGHYTGEYAIGADGNLVFPWEMSKKDQEKYQWRQTLQEVMLVKDGKLTSKVLEHPTAFDPPKKELIDELYRQSLIDTFQTYMHLQTTYGKPHVSIPTLVEDFCTKKKTFKKNLECSPDLQTYLAKEANKALKSSKPRTYDSAAKELNSSIVKLNALRKKLEDNSTYLTKSGIGKLLYPRWIDEKKAAHDYAEYERLYREMTSSGPGLFVATDELHDDLKFMTFEPISFILSPTRYPAVKTKDFKDAVEEAQELTVDHAHELLKIYHQKSPEDEKVSELIRLNPSATSQILLNRPEFGQMVCGGLRKISVDDETDRQLRLVTTWGGTIVGGALIFSGIGAGVGMSMVGLGTAGAVAMTPDVLMSYEELHKATLEKNAAFAEGNGSKAEVKATKHELAVTDFSTVSVLTGTALLVDVHAGMRAGKNLRALTIENEAAAKAAISPLKQFSSSVDSVARVFDESSVLAKKADEVILSIEKALEEGKNLKDIQKQLDLLDEYRYAIHDDMRDIYRETLIFEESKDAATKVYYQQTMAKMEEVDEIALSIGQKLEDFELKALKNETLLAGKPSPQSAMSKGFESIYQKIDVPQGQAKELIKEVQANLTKEVPINSNTKHSLKTVETKLQEELAELEENLASLKERNKNSPSPTPQDLELEKTVEAKVKEYRKTTSELFNLNLRVEAAEGSSLSFKAPVVRGPTPAAVPKPATRAALNALYTKIDGTQLKAKSLMSGVRTSKTLNVPLDYQNKEALVRIEAQFRNELIDLEMNLEAMKKTASPDLKLIKEVETKVQDYRSTVNELHNINYFMEP